jgi:hypothetical protein
MKNLFLVIYSSIIIIKLVTTNNAFNLIKDGFNKFSNGAKDTLKKVSNSVSNSVSNNLNNLKKVIDSKTAIEPRNEIKVLIKNDLEKKDKTKILSTYKFITTTSTTTSSTSTTSTTSTSTTISTSTTTLTTSNLYSSNATKSIFLYYDTLIANLTTASTKLTVEYASSSSLTKITTNFNLLISIKNIYSDFLLFSNIPKIIISIFIILLFFCICYAFSYLICSMYQKN